nr:ankyrin repeat domain-containing protein 7 isoform X3 [Pogona vitticeps]
MIWPTIGGGSRTEFVALYIVNHHLQRRRRMKKMKKILGLGRMRKEQQRSPAWSRAIASAPAICTSPLGCGGGSSYKMRKRDQGRLHQAVAKGDLGELQRLLQKHDLNEQDKAGRTPLLLACIRGHTDIVTFLVDNKCQLNICDSERSSPLMKAVQHQQEFCAIYLLEHGADPNLVDVNSNTALHFAASDSSTSIAKHLLDHKAHIEAQNKDGSTPLMIAVAENNWEMVEFLLKEGASVHATDKLGRTPLLIAASNKKHDLTNILLSYGSDVSHKDNSGQSAQDYVTHNDDPILQYRAEYSTQKEEAEDSPSDQKVLSVLSSPNRARDTDITLGASPTNQEGTDVHQSLSQASGDLGKETCINDHSSGDSLRDSGETDNDSSFSSEELDLNPKNPQKLRVPQLKHIFLIIKKYYGEQEINQSLEENISAGLQKTIYPTKKEKYDSDESSVSYKEEEEFDKEGKEEEEEEGGDGNKEEKEEEEEEDFSKETRDENMKESQGKIENGEEEYFEKVEKRESFTDNECEQERDLSSTDTGDCNAQDKEIQEAGEMPVSFIARHSECSDENAAINKVNYELSSDSFDKENSYKYDHQFLNTNGSQGTENNNIIAYENQKRFHRNIISSVDTFEMTTLAGAALPSVVNSHANKDTDSDWSYSTEDYNHQSDTECEDHKIMQQSSENSDIVGYQNTRGKQCMNAKELGEAICEQLVLKNENNKEEDPKVFQSELKEDSSEEVEKGDNKEEDGKNPNVVDKKMISYRSSQHQIFLQDDIVRKGMDEEEEEEKDTESPCISETSESPQKPAMGSLPASPATIKTPGHSITEEISGRSSEKIKFKEKGDEELEAKKEANIEKMLTANVEQKIEQKLPVQHNEAEDEMEGAIVEERQVTNLISSSYREVLLPISQKGLTTSVTEIRKSENMHQISTKRVSQQVTGQLHQLQDDSSISEALPEEGSMMDITKSKNKGQISIQRVSQHIIEKLHQLEDDSSLSEVCLKEERFCLKQEEEKWIYAEMLKTQEQLRKKELQYCKLLEEKQQLEFMLRSMKMELKILKNHLKQLQGTEEQYLQSKRHIHDLRNALDAKEHEINVTSQKLQDLLVAFSEVNNTIKQLEEHIQRLETENGRLEETTNQQVKKISTLQKDLQDSVTALNHLEEVITGLQREKINLEEQLNQQAQKQFSVTAQDSHNIWEEELKSPSHFSELDREKKELVTQFENEREKVKKLEEFKQSIEIRLDQEMKRNIELQNKYNGIKILLKITKKKLKEQENGESSSQTRCHGDRKNKYLEIDAEKGQLRKEKSFMCPLHLKEETPKRDDVIDLRQMQQYKKDIEEQAKEEVKKKLEEVNLFLQTQASSQETLEKIRVANNASLINQMESIIGDLQSERSKLKSRLQECLLQNEAMQTELKKYKDLYLEELKRRKSLGSKLVRSNEKLAEVKIKLFHERHKSKSLLANSFLSGSISASPILETGQLGNLGNNVALSRPCIPAAGFRNPTESPLASKRRVEAYLAEMQTEIEKNIRRELDQAKNELDAEFGRVCPVGSFDGSSKNLNVEQDPVSNTAQEYCDVLIKNYML